MAEESLVVRIFGDSSGLVKGVKEAEEALHKLLGGLGTGNFTEIAGGIGKLIESAGPLAAVAGAALLIHEAFKLVGESVEEATKWNLEAGKLARQLGITTEAASVLNNALEDHGVSVDAYTNAANFMTKSLSKSTLGFQNLGIETKNSDGSFRNTNVLMGEAIERLNEMPDSTEKNIVGQQIFGRAWLNSREILLITKEALAETAAQMETLGTKVTPQSEAASRKWSLAVADLHDVMAAFAINLGNKLMPVLTELVHWLADIGTGAVVIFRAVLDGLGTAFEVLGSIIRPMWATEGAALSALFSAWVDLGTSVRGMFAGLGNAFLDLFPSLREFGDWFGDKMPSATTIFLGILRSIATVVTGVAGALQGLITLASMFATLIVGVLGAAGAALLEFSLGNPAKAGAVFDKSMEAVMASVEAKGRALEAGVQKTKENIASIWGKETEKPEVDSSDESKGLQTKKIKVEMPHLFEDMKEELERVKDLRQNWYTWSNARELQYWQDQLKMTVAGSDAAKKVQTEITKARRAALKDEDEAEKARLTGKLAKIQSAGEVEVDALKHTEKMKAAAAQSGTEQKTTRTKDEAEVALVNAAEEEKGVIKLRVLREEQAAAQALQEELARLRQEELADVKRIEAQKLAEQLKTFAQLRTNAHGNKAAIEKVNDDQAKAEAASAKRMTALTFAEEDAREKDRVASSKRIQQVQHAADMKFAEDQKRVSKQIEGYLQPFVQGFSNGIKKILDGSLSLGDAVKGLGKMVTGAFIDMIGTMVQEWITSLAQLLAKWIATIVLGSAADEGSKATRLATGAAARTAEASGNAAVAATAAAASVAAIPLVGWAMWPGVMEATYAAVMAQGALAAASGGFDVPAGLNPLTQLHAEEMVLPAHLANAVRTMAAAAGSGAAPPMPTPGGRGGGGSSGGPTSINVNIQALDGPSVGRVLRSNGGHLVKVARELARDGKGRRR